MSSSKHIKYIFLLLPIFSYGQKEDTYSLLRKKYSNENAVFVSRREDDVIKIENNAAVIYSKVYEDLLLLTDKTSEYMDKEVYWQDFSSIKELDARSEIPDGGKFKTLKVKDFTPTNEISEGTFFDDERAYRFVYPGLVNGSREVLSYTEKITDPHLFGRFLFSYFAPAEDEQFSVSVPPDVKIRYKTFNIKDSLDFSVSQSGKNTVYTWKVHGSRKIKTEDDAPSIMYYVPHIVVLIDEYTVNGQQKKVLSNSQALYDWFYGLVKNVNTTVSPEVKKVTDSITAGASDNLEKVKRIFYWVQNNITYVAYEDSLGGMVPREAALVCSRRFGDCKDMASTLVEMIRAAGLEAYKTWIGTRDIPYSFKDVPSPMSTNHMICTYIDAKGKDFFLDATGKDAPFGFYTSMIQGKEAFIGKGPHDFQIVKVPEMDTDKNQYIDSTFITVDNSILKGTGILRLRGYEKINTGRRLMNVENKARQDLLIGLLAKGNNKFMVDSSSFKNLEDRDKDLMISNKFNVNDYIQNNGKDLYVNMQLEKQYKNDLLEPDREAPREFEYKHINRDVNILEIPKGYKVSYLPANSNYSGSEFGFKVNYKVAGNKIVYESYLYINTLMLNPSDFTDWNKMIRLLTKAYNESVTLTNQ